MLEYWRKVVSFWGAFSTITSIAPILHNKTEEETASALFSKSKTMPHLQGVGFLREPLTAVTSLVLDSALAS